MRLLMLAAAGSVHVVRWANGFVEKGLEVHLASQHPADPALSPKVQLHSLPHHHGLGYLLNGSKVQRLLAHIRPDVVNAHYASGYGSLARTVKGVPVVLNVWGSDVFEFPDKSPLHRALLLRNLRSATQLVSTSEFMAVRTRSLSTALPPLSVVPFGVGTDLFHPPATPRAGSPVVFGTVKTLAPKYGIDTLIRAFARVLADPRCSGCTLQIVGGGPQERELRALAAGLGVQASVEFTGAVPHSTVPQHLRGMDVFVALSRADSETFGVAIVEASATALPVVVSDAGGLPEVVVEGSTGYVVPREDVKAAADRMVELALSTELRRIMGAAGRTRVLDQYGWNTCLDRMIQVFHNVLGA
jgi:L-malate glycosyltransferase